jgi:hypothetical protein
VLGRPQVLDSGCGREDRPVLGHLPCVDEPRLGRLGPDLGQLADDLGDRLLLRPAGEIAAGADDDLVVMGEW